MNKKEDDRREDNPLFSYVKDMISGSLQELGKESAREVARHLNRIAKRLEKGLMRLAMTHAIMLTGVVFLLIALVMAIQNRTALSGDISFMIGGVVAIILSQVVKLLLKNRTEVK